MPRVLIVSPGYDVAGCGINLKLAFDHTDTDWEARHVRRRTKWLAYPGDAEWDQFEDLYRWADVLHIMDRPVEYRPRKPTIVHHLGTYYRRNPEAVSAECRRIGAVELASSHELAILPHLGFLPVTTDLDSHARLRQREYRPTSRVRVAHAPTNREFKSTEVILEALSGLDVDVDVIEGVPWAECLRRKAQADIFVDELTSGYGLNAIECWAMGIPVISGLTDPRSRAAMLTEFGELPFVDATPATLVEIVEQLVRSPELRAEHGERGRLHAERIHSERAVVNRAIPIYEGALCR